MYRTLCSRSSHILGLCSLLGLLALGQGCRQRTANDQADLKALQGQPEIYAGRFNFSNQKIEFYEIDAMTGRQVFDSSGQPVIRLARATTFAGFDQPLVIEGGKFGQALLANKGATYSWFSNTPWKCGMVEEMAKGVPSAGADKDEDCYIELTTTGDSGFAASIVGLGADGKGGLGNWINQTKPVLNSGTLHKVSDGLLKPGEVNTLIDETAVLKGMQNLAAKYPLTNDELVKERNTCLKNALATGWQDIQAHYYCIIYLNPHRTCYATALINARKQSITDPNNALFKNPFGFAYDLCFKDKGVIPAGDEPIFQYVMYTQVGALDFNIEAANEVINKFYGVTQPDPSQANYDGDKRPRRITDTYPNWLPDQPRYNKIRELQSAMQKKVAGGI